MDENTFQKKLNDLTKEIRTLPPAQRKRLEQLAEETKEHHTQITKNINSIQDSLDFLRISIKYLLFDLEATRRENTYLRKMLEETEE